jgi:hypothetical protein
MRIVCVYIHIPRVQGINHELCLKIAERNRADAVRALQKKAGPDTTVISMDAPFKADYHYRADFHGKRRRLVRVRNILNLKVEAV